MGSIHDLLSECRPLLTAIAALAADDGPEGLASLPDEELIEVVGILEEYSRLVGVAQVHGAAVVDDRSQFSMGSDGLSFRYGHRHPVHFIEDLTKISQSEAKRRMRMGKEIRSQTSMTGVLIEPRYSKIAKAVETGQIAVPVAERIIQSLEQARKNHSPNSSDEPEQWDGLMAAAEEHLVSEAMHQPMDSITVQITAWRDVLDPDGAPLRDEEIHARRGFRQGKERNGITRNTWDTDGPLTALLKGIFEESAAASKPRFFTHEQDVHMKTCNVALADPEETAAQLTEPTLDGSDPNDAGDPHASTGGIDCDEFGSVEAIKDTRTRAQRDSDVLAGYLRAGVRASENEMGGIKPIVEVTAVVTLADLQTGRGVGWIDGIEESVSIDTIKEMACENGYRPILVGNSGEVLWLGKEPRFFTDAQRRAVIVRDGAFCAIKGCTRPARQCHMHHIVFHSLGGPSDVDNAILLCSEHHHMIHKSPFKIVMRNGRPHILAPRWIDPFQTWIPMGAPRFHGPQFHGDPVDDPPSHHPDPERANHSTSGGSGGGETVDPPHAHAPSGSPQPDDLWAGLPEPCDPPDAQPKADDLWDNVPTHTDPYAFDPETDDLWFIPPQPDDPATS